MHSAATLLPDLYGAGRLPRVRCVTGGPLPDCPSPSRCPSPRPPPRPHAGTHSTRLRVRSACRTRPRSAGPRLSWRRPVEAGGRPKQRSATGRRRLNHSVCAVPCSGGPSGWWSAGTRACEAQELLLTRTLTHRARPKPPSYDPQCTRVCCHPACTQLPVRALPLAPGPPAAYSSKKRPQPPPRPEQLLISPSGSLARHPRGRCAATLDQWRVPLRYCVQLGPNQPIAIESTELRCILAREPVSTRPLLAHTKGRASALYRRETSAVSMNHLRLSVV